MSVYTFTVDWHIGIANGSRIHSAFVQFITNLGLTRLLTERVPSVKYRATSRDNMAPFLFTLCIKTIHKIQRKMTILAEMACQRMRRLVNRGKQQSGDTLSFALLHTSTHTHTRTQHEIELNGQNTCYRKYCLSNAYVSIGWPWSPRNGYEMLTDEYYSESTFQNDLNHLYVASL